MATASSYSFTVRAKILAILTVCLVASTAEAATPCSPPNITVKVGGSAFQVPIFKDCNDGDPASVTPPQSSAPVKATSASADYSRYVDSKGAPLSSDSTKKLLAHFGKSVALDVLLEQTICTVTDTQSTPRIFKIQKGEQQLDGGKEVTVGSYRCVIDL
ncbi:hypothetical protein PZA11_004541 [Diplocarpon coronariae]|uniref:Uncharacterized protein n=1 Tax=Diplocarpon coronariae TaxID=2795749 RepID=A0A218ZAP1_9HELO|nr:hypothetical protein JHW43_005325 [Diplocarpon mali]OWP04832.1 hypothetical protein B2J93_4114 [Marssonina coronariae]